MKIMPVQRMTKARRGADRGPRRAPFPSIVSGLLLGLCMLSLLGQVGRAAGAEPSACHLHAHAGRPTHPHEGLCVRGRLQRPHRAGSEGGQGGGHRHSRCARGAEGSSGAFEGLPCRRAVPRLRVSAGAAIGLQAAPGRLSPPSRDVASPRTPLHHWSRRHHSGQAVPAAGAPRLLGQQDRQGAHGELPQHLRGLPAAARPLPTFLPVLLSATMPPPPPGPLIQVPTKLTGQCGSVSVRLIPAPRGAGIVAAR